jgi:hypothetical protein
MALIAVCLAACSDGKPKAPAATSVEVLALRSDLPACNRHDSGHVYYVEAEEQFYFCDGSHLQEIELSGDPAATAAPWLIATSNTDSSVCAAGGIVVRVGPDENGNGSLDVNEITSATVVCNGVPGEAEGDVECSVIANDEGTNFVICVGDNSGTININVNTGSTEAPAVSDAGLTCTAELTQCGANCVDLDTDPRNCRECGRDCGADSECHDGTCHVSCEGNPACE